MTTKDERMAARRITKPAPPHNSLLAPGVCMCVECCRKVLTLRCPVVGPGKHQCGNYKGHRGDHTLLVCSTFTHAAERVKLDDRPGCT